METQENITKYPTRWKKGQSGNPKGNIPKGYSITEMMRSMLKQRPEVKEKIGNAIADRAMQGDQAAIKLLWNYMDGLPVSKDEERKIGGVNIFILSGMKEVPKLHGRQEILESGSLI